MDINGRPDNLEDYLIRVRTGQWFGWSDAKNKIYANLIVYDGGSKPTEQECTDGLAHLQPTYEDEKIKRETDKTNANQKLKDLGLTDDEIKAIKGIS